jgi:hypothetical protein
MKKIYYLLLLVSVATFSQNGVHTPTSRVSRLFVSKDESKFLTLSGTEIVLWDNTTNQMIWTKKVADLGLGNEILYDFIIGVDPYLKYLVVTNKQSYRKLVNLTNFTTSSWPYYTYDFVNDGRIAVMDYDYNKKNSHKAYLLNLDNGNKELIAEKIGDMRVLGDKKLIELIYHNKTVNDYDEKSKIYDITTKSTKKLDFDTRSLFNNYKSLNYNVNYSFSDKTIKTTDQSGKQISFFTIKNPVHGGMESNKTHLFYVSEINPHAYFLEQDTNKPNEKLSYMYVYNITNGDVIKKVELHDTSDKSKLIAKSEIEKQNQIDAEKQRIFNLPENVLKRRLLKVQGDGYKNYVCNSQTKCVYYVVPDKPLYEGNLVRMDALNDDPKLIIDVYEKLENLENPVLYRYSNSKPKTCSHCNGKGIISKTSQRTVADYEYTLGKKIVETTTHKNACGNCGGCGLVLAD